MAAGATYVPIATQTLGSSASSVTFSSIPQTYTDLVLIVSGTDSIASSAGVACRVGNNSVDSGTNYSSTYLYGNGSSASTGRQSNVSNAYVGRIGTGQGSGIANFQNYSNTTTYKTILARGNDSSYLFDYVNLWRNTAAINTIYLYSDSTNNFASGCTFTLYGIAAA
jgi:hypothetical protein